MSDVSGNEATGSFIKEKHCGGPYGFNPANVYNLQHHYCPNHCFLASHKRNPSLWLAIIFTIWHLLSFHPAYARLCVCVRLCWGPERGLMITPSGRRQTVRVWYYFCIMPVNEHDTVKRMLEQAPTKLFKTLLRWLFCYLCSFLKKMWLFWVFGAQKAAEGRRHGRRC